MSPRSPVTLVAMYPCRATDPRVGNTANAVAAEGTRDPASGGRERRPLYGASSTQQRSGDGENTGRSDRDRTPASTPVTNATFISQMTSGRV